MKALGNFFKALYRAVVNVVIKPIATIYAKVKEGKTFEQSDHSYLSSLLFAILAATFIVMGAGGFIASFAIGITLLNVMLGIVAIIEQTAIIFNELDAEGAPAAPTAAPEATPAPAAA